MDPLAQMIDNMSRVPMQEDEIINRELDIWIAEEMGMKCLGWAWCSANPEASYEWYGFSESEIERECREPVFSIRCLCDICKKNDDDMIKEHPEFKEEVEREAKTIFGHRDNCLEVIPYFHERRSYLPSILEHFEKKNGFTELFQKTLLEKYSIIEILKLDLVEMLKIIKSTTEKI